MIKLNNNEECIIEIRLSNDQNLYQSCEPDCEPYCNPNCNPKCNPVCSPSCHPCYPGNHCNPETFYCSPDREEY